MTQVHHTAILRESFEEVQKSTETWVIIKRSSVKCVERPDGSSKRRLIISNTVISRYLGGPCRHSAQCRGKDSRGPLSGQTGGSQK